MHYINVGGWSRTFESISPIIAQISQKWPILDTLEALKSMFTELIRQFWDLILDQEIKGYRMSHSCLRRLSTHFESSYSILQNWKYSHGSLKLIINGSGFALIKLANQNPVFGSGFAITNIEPRNSNLENHLKMRGDTTQTSSKTHIYMNLGM
jgi:hypothetical protein